MLVSRVFTLLNKLQCLAIMLKYVLSRLAVREVLTSFLALQCGPAANVGLFRPFRNDPSRLTNAVLSREAVPICSVIE